MSEQIKLVIDQESFWAMPKGQHYEVNNHLISAPLLCGDMVSAAPDPNGRMRVNNTVDLQDLTYVLFESDNPAAAEWLEKLGIVAENFGVATIAGINEPKPAARAIILAAIPDAAIQECWDVIERQIETQVIACKPIRN